MVSTRQAHLLPNLRSSAATPYECYWQAEGVVRNGGLWFVFNPSLGLFNEVQVPTDPTLGSKTGISPLWCSNDNDDLNPLNVNVSQGTSHGCLDSNGGTQYAGLSRFLGAEVEIETTATRLDTGGSIYVVHNEGRRSLVSATHASGTNYNYIGANSSQVRTNPRTTKFYNFLSGYLHTSILPSAVDDEPRRIQSDWSRMSSDIGKAPGEPIESVGNSSGAVIPGKAGEVAANGWTWAICYRPAETILDGQNAKVHIRIKACYLANMSPLDGSGTSWASVPAGVTPNQTTASSPSGHAVVSKGLAMLRNARNHSAHAVATVQRKGITWNGVKTAAEKGGLFGAGSYLAGKALGGLGSVGTGAVRAIEDSSGPIITEMEDGIGALI